MANPYFLPGGKIGSDLGNLYIIDVIDVIQHIILFTILNSLNDIDSNYY